MSLQENLESTFARLVAAIVAVDNKTGSQSGTTFGIVTQDPVSPENGAAWILQQDKTIYECVGFMGAMPIMQPSSTVDYDFVLCIKTPSTIKRLVL